MTTFSLGQSEHGPLKIDLPRLVDTRAAIMASSGGGKSWLFRLIAERVAAKIQTILIDPEGEFPTLREKLDIILVGEGGELAADVRTAKLLARKLAELRVSAVIDLSNVQDEDNEPWDARRAYLAAFVEGLMNIPKNLYASRLILIDEAHQFAPEAASAKKDSPVYQSRRAVASLMSAGRKRGLGTLLATQRISKLHKDSLAEAKNIFIGQTTLDIDQQRTADILGIAGKDRTLLRDLDPGEFYAFGPALADKGVFRFHSDQVITTHPKAGQRLTDVPKPSASIRGMVSELGDLPAEVQHDADVLAAAQREVVELKRDLAQAKSLAARPVQVAPKIETVEVPVLNGEAKTLEAAVGQMNEISASLSSASGAILGAANDIAQALRNFNSRPAPAMRPVVPARPAPAPRPVGSAQASTDLPRGERAVLEALIQYPNGLRREQLTVLTSYKRSTRDKYLQLLNEKGYVNTSGKQVMATTEGIAALPDAQPLPAGRALQEFWLAQLPTGERAILEVLIREYPESIDRTSLDAVTGYKRSSRDKYLQLLSAKELITDTGRGQVRASENLF